MRKLVTVIAVGFLLLVASATTAAAPPVPKLGEPHTITSVTAIPSNSSGIGVSSCGAGEVALGGGYFYPQGAASITQNRPNSDANNVPRNWQVNASNGNSSGSENLTVYVVCAPLI